MGKKRDGVSADEPAPAEWRNEITSLGLTLILTPERKVLDSVFPVCGNMHRGLGWGGAGPSLQVFVGFAAASTRSCGSSEVWGCT